MNIYRTWIGRQEIIGIEKAKGQEGSRSFFFWVAMDQSGQTKATCHLAAVWGIVGQKVCREWSSAALFACMWYQLNHRRDWFIKNPYSTCLLLPAKAVQGIVEWYGSKGIQLAPFNVHFFGDRTENIGPFRQTGFNSHEISCSSRDYQIGNGIVGLCGAQLHEILDTKGVAECWQLDSKY